ncbi:hypothetical protein AVEN_243585-1 [Araneus ventricosus]|uniref:Uncharacterized protein n=1 Tax=Araneus ventricosus TaxID=182803 RepID=A0A4Y2A640_ARAVE|nr:hypothetical protein AVEN_243585-1 [Araneus ventricosus]
MRTPLTSKELPPPCRSIRDQLNNSHHDVNTRTEGRILMAIIGLGPTPPAGGTFLLGLEKTQPHTITLPTRETRTSSLIRWLLIHVFVVPSPVGYDLP